jgi:hypothetical protein
MTVSAEAAEEEDAETGVAESTSVELESVCRAEGWGGAAAGIRAGAIPVGATPDETIRAAAAARDLIQCRRPR